jgi:hypothetical protein
MKDEGAIDWREGFPTSIGQREQVQGGSWRCTKEGEEYIVFWGKKKEENENVKRKLVFMCGKVSLKKKRDVCKQEHGRKLLCSKYLKWSSWKDFHDKTSGFLFKIIFPLKSTVGFVSNLKEF